MIRLLGLARGSGHRGPQVVSMVAAGVVLSLVATSLVRSAPPPPQQRHEVSAPRLLPAALDSCGLGSAGSATGPIGSPPSVAASAVPDHQELVSPAGAPRVVAFDGAQVVVPAGAVRAPVPIGVSDLIGAEVPKLDAGMTNVTGARRGGFRFTPHPMRFASDVELTLPYEPELVPAGMTVDDVHTYFYDDVTSCWRPLQRKSVDKQHHTVTSLTNHFTDFINTTVTAPDSPENVSFNPNQIKGISAADPGMGISVLGAPRANSQGTNDLSYPIAVPAGRLGMQPSLAVSYDSTPADGWLGVGWGLALPQITIDTRLGVPRYDADRETETYLLNGAQLTPLADRGAPVARAAERVFHTRVEGAFARIVRHGNGPSTYTWEVVDKAGTHLFYGALAGASGLDAGQTLSGGDANGSGVYVWPVREVRDAHGNFMRFTYVKQADPGVPGGHDGVNLYPQTITYTGSGSDPGRYKVTFVRDRDLGEPLRVDKQIDARGGFKRVTADLLRHVDVTFIDNPATGHEQLVRRYVLSYTTGAFGKTLLSSVGQADDTGVAVGTHTFGYFDDVRNGGSYQGFADGVNWSVPGDSLANSTMNSILTGSGGASVISANSTATVGGHLFIGGGTGSPVSKSDKIGPKVGASSSSNEVLIAMVDVDGDGLPDKVFRTGNVLGDPSFWYRKNLSRPGGQLAFSDVAKQLNLPSIGHGSSNSWVWGIEGYAGSVAAQLDRVQVSSTQSRYFADVNDDGIADLVDDSGVWFGRLGADGAPVYGLNDSAATAAPIHSRPVDTSVLGNLGPAPTQLVDANPPADSIRRWLAPFDGDVAVNAPVRLAAATKDARAASKTADGVRVAIQLDGSELGSLDLAATDNSAQFVVPSTQSIRVHQGDRLYFRVGSHEDGSLDQVDWDPVISYLNLETQNTVDENALLTRDFHQAADFTLGGRATQVLAPLTGTLHLSGAVVKAHATSDDVTVVLTRDGTSVFSQTIPASTSGSTAISVDVAVTQGQVLTWKLQIDSPVDLGSLSWVPRADYTSAAGVDRVVDEHGDPLISLFPPYDVDMYPDDGGLTGPRDPFTTGTDDGDYSIQPDLSFAPPADPDDPKPSGQVVFTVKRRNQLLGKRVMQITNGKVASVSPIVVHETFGPPNPGQDATPDTLFFDYSTRDSGLRSFKPSPGVTVTFDPADPESAPSTVDAAAVFRTPVVDGGFPQPYRGWASIAYNGAGSRATDPIVESNLVIDHDYADQFPDSVDPQGQKDDFNNDPHVDVPKAFALAPSPKDGQWSAGRDLWVGANGASSSRLGTDSVALPSGSDFGGAIAVPRVSNSTQTSLTGSVSIAGGSEATGDSVGQVDFLDLNGDGFPDVVSGGGIQYSDPDGGLGARRGGLPNGAVRSSSTDAGNVGIHASTGGAANSGSPAQTTPDGSGLAAPTGTRSANTAHGGNTQQSFGAGGSEDIGFSDSDSRFDLTDVNGDGLPDRVYADGGVRLNFGYSFGDKEQWPSPTPTQPAGAPLNDGGGTTTSGGLNLGFNTDSYSFAGGVSFSEDLNGTSATLADVNGDGLPDRVFDGNPIMVGFNTGNGFATPVPFGGGLAEPDPRGSRIGSDQNASLGGGVYATFGFCFVDLCVVFNPGADASTGVSRSVQALRDVNGDGFADQVVSANDDQLLVAANTTGRTNLLKSVTLPLGGQMTFDYSRDGNTQQLPQSRFVLSRVSVNDVRPGDGANVQATTFSYAGGVYDRAEREFDGYDTVTSRQVDAGNNDAVLRTITDAFRTDGPYTRGLLTKVVTSDAAGHTFVETDNTYTLHNVDTNSDGGDPHSSAATIFPQLTRTDTKWFEGQNTPGKTTFITTKYDSMGNVVESFDAGEDGIADDLDTTMSYTVDDLACQASGIIGIADGIDVKGGGVLARHRVSTVDCATGNVTQVRQQLDGDQVAVTDMEYFANGNLKKTTDPANLHGQRYFESFGYDTTVGSYVESIDDAYGLHSSSTHDFRLGTLLSSTDENNQRISYGYDANGRPVTVVGPYEQGSSNVTIRFEYHPEASVPYALTKHVDRQANGLVRTDTIDTINFVDGLGRVIETKIDAAISTGPTTLPENDMIVSGRVDRDGLGRAVKTFYPITEPKGAGNTTLNPAFTEATFDTVQPTVTTYDVLDRATRVTLPDNTTSTISHGFGTDRAGHTQFETIAADANGKSARSYTDVRAHTTAVKQFNPQGGQAVIWTSFGYDALGEKTSIQDDHNNTTSMTYDAFGRQRTVTSPDSGATGYVYDLASDLIQKTTANRPTQPVNYDYEFTRPKSITYPVFTGNNVTHTYGGPGAANNAAGRITHITDAAGSVDRKYGPLGEVTSETRSTIGAANKPVSFTTGYQYDTWNRLLKLTYPDGEVLSYFYNTGGQVEGANGDKVGPQGKLVTYDYLHRLTYDKFGQPVQQRAGNGVFTQHAYDSKNRRLTNLTSNLATFDTNGQPVPGFMFQNLNYAYDNVGNITQIQNNTVSPTSTAVGATVGGPSTQTFSYDDLSRLTHAQGSYTPAGKTDTYTQDLTYDSISNLTNKTENHTIVGNGGTTVDGTLTYNNTYTYNGATPHAASTVGVFTFQYDANGNQISREQQSGPRQQLIWDEDNRLSCDHQNDSTSTLPQDPSSCDGSSRVPDAAFRYDDRGNRIVKKSANLHIYPNQFYSTVDKFEYKHVYVGSSHLVTQLRDDGKVENQQFWTNPDALGSTSFVTTGGTVSGATIGADGKLAQHIDYLPGGETWVNEDPVQPIPQQYTGKELDPETGLYYYGARYYNPQFQQFQSPDPAPSADAADTTSLSTYLYARGNPVNFTDPDGRQPACPSCGPPLSTEQVWKEWKEQVRDTVVDTAAGAGQGVIAAATAGAVPVDPNLTLSGQPTVASQFGAEMGAAMWESLPLIGSTESARKAVTGESVTGMSVGTGGRLLALARVILEFLPFFGTLAPRQPGPARPPKAPCPFITAASMMRPASRRMALTRAERRHGSAAT